MKVTFATFGEQLASSRLRGFIPQVELSKLGIGRGEDVIIYGKHWIPFHALTHFGKLVFDITDDHFDGEHGNYYRAHAKSADLVTCSSQVLRQTIKLHTGRDAVVIPEPYESEEGEPAIGENLLWFGHASNLPDLHRLGIKAKVLTNKPPYEEWSKESFKRETEKPCIVIIPTGKSMAKSENRMVESIRRGRYVCAEYLPSYEPFYQFFPCYSIREHIDKALDKSDESIDRIRQAQDFIRQRYSPKSIGLMWKQALESL